MAKSKFEKCTLVFCLTCACATDVIRWKIEHNIGMIFMMMDDARALRNAMINDILAELFFRRMCSRKMIISLKNKRRVKCARGKNKPQRKKGGAQATLFPFLFNIPK